MMARTRSGTRPPAVARRGASSARRPEARSTQGNSGTFPRWAGLVVALVVALALGGWWAASTLGGRTGRDAARPIARVEAPDVHSLLVDPTDPDRVLFGSHAGIQESRDGGFTWEQGGLANADAMSVAASPENPSTLYVAGHDVFLVSRDGGETWQPVAHDLPGTDLHAFAQDPTDPRRLYALVVGAGVFASEDGGTTWAPLPSQPPGVGGHGALATDGENLYAVTQAGIVASRDRGASWEALPAQPGAGVIALAAPAASPRTLYAGTTAGLAKSADGGASWIPVGPADVPVLALGVGPADPGRLLVVDDTGAVYRSDDAGASWAAPR